MPSLRKLKTRDDDLYKDGWFGITPDIWRPSSRKPGKARMVSDANFPLPLVRAMIRRGLDIRTAHELGLSQLADDELLEQITKMGRILLTMDADFWSDTKFPLHRVGCLVFVEGNESRIERTDGFDLLILFLTTFGGASTRMKIKATSDRIFTKINVDGKKTGFEIKGFRPFIYAREMA